MDKEQLRAPPSGDYPKDNNPFEANELLINYDRNGKKTKSTKKREKKAKKTQKKEIKSEKKRVKKEKKELKAGKKQLDVPDSNTKTVGVGTKNGTTNNNKKIEKPLAGSESTSHTLPSPVINEPEPSLSNSKVTSNTLDVRLSPAEPGSPTFTNKRVLQLKTSRESGESAPHSSLPDLSKKPHFQYRPGLSGGSSSELQQTSPTASPALLHKSNQRPNSLEVTFSPQKRCPSPLVPRAHPENEEVKMYRTQSISKKGKDKKKKKKLKRILKKKKKKSKSEKLTTVLEDQALTDQVVLRRPKVNKVDELRKEVEEIKESVRSSVISLVEERNSNLDRLTANVEELEEFSHGFATTAQQARLKKQAQARCCGIGSRWKVCWYICACQGKVKRKKRKEWKATNDNASPESQRMLEIKKDKHRDDDDDDDYYRPAHNTLIEAKPIKEETQVHIASKKLSSSVENLSTSPSKDDSVEQQIPETLKSRLLKFPKTLRGSTPNLLDDTPPMGRSLRSMAGIDPRERKSSSVNALHEIVKKRGAKKREEKLKKERQKREEDISIFASKYEDEETRKKVKDLLSLDL